MRYFIEREKDDIRLAEGLSLSFYRKGEDSTQIGTEPGCRRLLALADGNVVVAREGKSVESAEAGQQQIIDGQDAVKIFGKFHGVCISVKEDMDAASEVIDIKKDQMTLDPPEAAGKTGFVQLITACRGYAVITIAGESLMLDKGETLCAVYEEHDAHSTGVMGQGSIIVNTFAASDAADEAVFCGAASGASAAGSEDEACAEGNGRETAGSADASVQGSDSLEDAKRLMKEKKAEKRGISLKGATFSDFVLAMKITTTGNGIGKRFSSFRKNNWFDPELELAVDKMERKHLSPIIWVVVLVVIMAVLGFQTSFAKLMICAGIWTVIDILLVTPLVYLLTLPKPVGPHVKKLSDLTEEEKRIREKGMDKNRIAHKKRVLHRY